jgi:hypothetical protein
VCVHFASLVAGVCACVCVREGVQCTGALVCVCVFVCVCEGSGFIA